jgi:hypothetical protein
MKQLALAQMDGKMMTTATVMTQLMRLQQITCGHFTADDGTIKDRGFKPITGTNECIRRSRR